MPLHLFLSLMITLAISFPLVAEPIETGASGEGKPQAESDSKKAEAVATEKPTTETTKHTEEKTTETTEQTPSGTAATTKKEVSRDFLKLAEPKSTKKQPQKRHPWGGYWSAVYRDSSLPGEEDQDPEGLESQLPSPKPQKHVEKPLSLAEYKEVDFAKFASGMYVSDYAGKYVKFYCRFASLAPEETRLANFPPPKYVNFIIVSTGSSMENLTVVAGAELGDKIFQMESGKEITLYGLAQRLSLSAMTLVVDEIEVNQQ